MSADDALAWRAERALHRAWPALEETRRGAWLARSAPGVSRRANSANPTRATLAALDADIAACEEFYRARGAPAIFRLPSLVEPAADRRLEQRDYVAEGGTLTLYSDLTRGVEREPDVTIASRPDAQWLAALAGLQGQTSEQAAVYARIVASIAIPVGFAGLRVEGEWAALAYGAVDEGLLCCESVVVDARLRGRGHGRRLLAALLAWGAARGAEDACLQVDAANTPALALYRGLGLTRELYRYHYRRAPKVG